MAEAGVPGVAVGVRVGGEEIAVGYGVTSVEDPLPVHERTLFQIGSVSKTFTATAIMALVEQGRLTLDDPVGRHLPTFRLATPGLADRVTVRHLLTHAGGFVGDWLLVRPPALGEGDDALARTVDALADVPQLFPPGGGWSYNNAGFALAGRVVEVLTGRPYAAALRDLVLEPLGLSGTFVSADEAITHRTALPHASTEHPPCILRGKGWQPGWQLARADVPLGGLISNVQDLLGWARFHIGVQPRVRRPVHRSAGAPSPPCRPRSSRRAASPTTSGRVDAPDGRRAALVGHGGLTTGYATAFTLVPDAQAAVAILTNATPGGTWLGREVTRTLLRETIGVDDAPPAPAPGLAGDSHVYTGRYDNPFAIQRIRVGAKTGELVLEHHAPEPRARPVGSRRSSAYPPRLPCPRPRRRARPAQPGRSVRGLRAGCGGTRGVAPVGRPAGAASRGLTAMARRHRHVRAGAQGHGHGVPGGFGAHGNPRDFRLMLGRLEDPARARWQRPVQLIRALGLRPGQDRRRDRRGVGLPRAASCPRRRAAGPRLRRRRGAPDASRVYSSAFVAPGSRNVTPVLGRDDDPLLPDGAVRPRPRREHVPPLPRAGPATSAAWLGSCGLADGW